MSMSGLPRTSPESRPQRADARRNRVKILAAAEVAFARGGAAASTEDVARRAGVSIGTVFKHFPTKQDLLIALVKQSLQRLAEHALELSRAQEPAQGLFVFLRVLADEARSRSTVISLLPAQMSDPALATSTGAFTEAVATLLSYAQESGTVRGDVTAADILALVTALTHTSASSKLPGQTHEHVLTVITDGLRPPPRIES